MFSCFHLQVVWLIRSTGPRCCHGWRSSSGDGEGRSQSCGISPGMCPFVQGDTARSKRKGENEGTNTDRRKGQVGDRVIVYIEREKWWWWWVYSQMPVVVNKSKLKRSLAEWWMSAVWKRRESFGERGNVNPTDGKEMDVNPNVQTWISSLDGSCYFVLVHTWESVKGG